MEGFSKRFWRKITRSSKAALGKLCPWIGWNTAMFFLWPSTGSHTQDTWREENIYPLAHHFIHLLLLFIFEKNSHLYSDSDRHHSWRTNKSYWQRSSSDKTVTPGPCSVMWGGDLGSEKKTDYELTSAMLSNKYFFFLTPSPYTSQITDTNDYKYIEKNFILTVPVFVERTHQWMYY